jgi:hypothetical protein
MPRVCQGDTIRVERRARCLTLGLLGVLLAMPVVAQEQPPTTGSDVAVSGVVIPTGFQGREYSAMIQIAVEGSPLPDTTWDLGASFAPQGRAAQDFSGRVVAGEPGTPVVFEIPVEFRPGSYALSLTARETTAGQSGTRKLEGNWPDPSEERATISPVILLQPARGAFVRGENSRTQGALALGDEARVQTPLPTAVVCVVCRGARLPDLIRVERKLVGTTAVDFKPIHLLPGQDQCAQVRDMISPGTLGTGHFKYEVHLVTQSGEIASAVREFETVADAPGSRPGP